MGSTDSKPSETIKKEKEPAPTDNTSSDSGSDESWMDETAIGASHTITPMMSSKGDVVLSLKRKQPRVCSTSDVLCSPPDCRTCGSERRTCTSFFSKSEDKSYQRESAQEDGHLDELQKLLGGGSEKDVLPGEGGEEKELCCSAGHLLVEFEVGPGQYQCDICFGQVPRGSMRYACDECKFDLCPKCAGNWNALKVEKLADRVREETEREAWADWRDAYNETTTPRVDAVMGIFRDYLRSPPYRRKSGCNEQLHDSEVAR